MPLITIKLTEGRTSEQKQALTKRITEAFQSEMGIPAAHIWTVYEDVAAEEWYMGEESIAAVRRRRAGQAADSKE